MERIESIDGLFHEGNPASGQKGTKAKASWFNNVQEELVAVIEAAGAELAGEQQDQLLKALLSGKLQGVLFASQYATLALADAAALAAGKLLVINTSWDLVPATLSAKIMMLPGGVLDDDGSVAIVDEFQGAPGCIGINQTVTGLTGTIHGSWFGVTKDGVTNDQAAVDKAFASGLDNTVVDLRAPKSHIKYGTGSVNPIPDRLIEKGDVSFGVTDTIRTPRPSSFLAGDTHNEALALGLYRRYLYTSGNSALQSGFLLDLNVHADVGATSTSAAGFQVKTKLSTEAPHQFAFHNFQSYLESSSGSPSEPTAGYFACYATGGGTPWGLVVASHATGGNQANHVYGIQIEVSHETAPYVSGKGLSIWARILNAVGGAIGGVVKYGQIIWGERGYEYGSLVTNKGDRNENETPHFGSIDTGYAVEGSDRVYLEYAAAGIVPIAVGDIIGAGSSGRTATITHVSVETGSWAAGTATGKLWTANASGAFIVGEDLFVAGVKRATGDADWRSVGSITTAFRASNVTDKAFCVTDAAGNTVWAVSGKGVTTKNFNPATDAATTIDASLGEVCEIAASALGCNITDILNPGLYQELTIIGGGGATPSVVKHNLGAGGTNISLPNGDWTGLAGHVLKLVWNGQWREVTRT